ncbi:AMP-dependent synthetase/ligase [Sanguibacter antarcticus]|uniref:Long-chain acyl-CoA synthetase n=1 Tax=Sanguibacter antarcticus TaxID=372484 RepID=A0A2A9E602_9MICO|nr:AMP-dependent synthetase/ligase [Sanguibacter antarcticus]PFG33600.1 long-chain acyl-CoA synthetase [Sanguibacter antarcticus]
MREKASPSHITIPPETSINTLLADRVRTAGADPLYERKSDDGTSWTSVSAQSFADDVAAVAGGLVARGVEVGDRVAIMSHTRYEWTLLDFAVWAVGAVPVPVYETSSIEQVRWILDDSGACLALVETAAHATIVAAARTDLPALTDVLVIEDDAVGLLRAAGVDIDAAQVTARSTAVHGDDLSTIIYTSGTTGRPKGAELTHHNFVFLTRNGVEGLGDVCAGPEARTLLFMPLAHVFARFIQVLCVTSGAVLGHTSDTRTLLPDLTSFGPTFLLAVPRVFEKVYNSSEQKAGVGPRLTLFRWAAKVAVDTSTAWDSPTRPSLGLRAQHAVADALVYGRLRAALGGHATYAISGGAPLGERLGHFYRGIGLTVLEGYGLTETTSATAVGRPGSTRVGTVGLPFPGTAVRVTDDGEILVHGGHVFRGYRNDPDATAEALVDGWFRTGDLGTLDDDGFLRITGRTKEIIVTAGGKNVAPALLEDRFRGHPLVSQCVVVGDQQRFIAALVTLDEEMLPGWLRTHGLPDMDVRAAAVHPTVLEALERAAARSSEVVSRAESIRKVRVLTTDFTERNGYLTPSLKVRRSLVVSDFAADITALYAVG